VPGVLLLAPPPVAKLTDLADMFRGSEEKSRRFSREYRRVAEGRGCALLDTATVISSSDLDGIHFEKQDHAKLADAVAVRRLLER